MSIVETFRGYIETTQDTLLIFEACRRGLLPRICRRLQEKERRIVQSGTVFVFDERESGIKRWTDGLVWSPSRILGNFLVYRELDKRNASGKKDTSPIDRASRSSSGSDVESALEKNKERALVGSLTNSYRFKKNGLIKKTMSIVVNGVSQHLISYYTKEDVLAGRLHTPSSVPELASLEISPEFLMKQNFRIPPTVEQSYDLGDHIQSPVSNNHSPRTPSGPFHTMNANGADFTSTGFGNHIRPKTEPDLVGSSPIDVFAKSYHHQQTHHSMHPQQGYHGMAHISNGGGSQHHHNSHPYSPQHATFPQNFAYGPVSNGSGSSSQGSQDQTSTTPPPMRYLPRSHPNHAFTPYPPTTQSPQSSSSQQQRHSLSPGGQYGASPAMMMPNPNTNGHFAAHDFNLSMGYHSPATTSPGTFGGLSSNSPQSSHSHIPQQHHHHINLPPVTQGWGDFGYSSYATGPVDHHDQHDHDSSSP
ncbi:hypothetical protein EC957_003156 [Mortierella hygrophila]|uniref:Uncharacterized protein n=1 Tax=Mortierella hygrophila TaxID=979708 RepID=A0A9P6K7J0_9FUNG|nr:hypothetical protein EC957_003156 [Mortierella hygrophila]